MNADSATATGHRTYHDELRALPGTYELWRDGLAQRGFHDHLTRLTGRDVVLVGSGGSLPVAMLGAHLHRSMGAGPATIMTPLDLASLPTVPGAIVIVSESLSHPDALLAVDVARQRRVPVRLLLTTRHRDAVGHLDPDATVLTCPRHGADGYVSTNSVLAMCLGLLDLYGLAAAPPAWDQIADCWISPQGVPRHMVVTLPREEVVCIHGTGLGHVAFDLDTRMAETGLSRVARTDLRGLGHGRHVGLYRRAAFTTLLILSDDRSKRLADATVEVLPPELPVKRWEARLSAPWSSIELLLASFACLASAAQRVGLDPGNPRLWPDADRLFRLQASTFIDRGPR